MITRRALLSAAVDVILPTPAIASQPTINVLHVILDDAWLGDLSDALPLTRAALESGLAEYPQHYATTPLCCPSRSSIMTGQYARHHGVLANDSSNDGGWATWQQRGLDDQALAPALHDAGVRTGLFGKVNNGYTGGVPDGWDCWRGLVDGTYDDAAFAVIDDAGQRRLVRNEWIDDYVSRQAREFVATDQDQPWYCYLAYRSPHGPAIWPNRMDGTFTDVQRPRDATFRKKLCGAPPIIASKAEYDYSADDYDREERGRRRMLAAVDEGLSGIIVELAATGQLVNTLVLIAPDNGWSAGAHRWRRKSLAYDRCARVGMIAAGPGIAPGTHGELVANIDHAPTIAARYGLTMPAADGIDFLGGASRDALLIENHLDSGNPAAPAFAAVRTVSDLYIRWRGGHEEYYDYAADPSETQNLLAGCATMTPDPMRVDWMRQRLADFIAGIPTATTRRLRRSRRRA